MSGIGKKTDFGGIHVYPALAVVDATLVVSRLRLKSLKSSA